MLSFLLILVVAGARALSISGMCSPPAPYQNVAVLTEEFLGFQQTPDCTISFEDPQLETESLTVYWIGLTYNLQNALVDWAQVTLTLNIDPVSWSIQSYSFMNIQEQSTLCPFQSMPVALNQPILLPNCAGFTDLQVSLPPPSTVPPWTEPPVPHLPWLWNVPWSTWFIIAGLPALVVGIIIGVISFAIASRCCSKKRDYVTVN